MKVFFDTEFDDRGREVILLSIGAVREDGAEYYAENGNADLARCNEWVQANVFPQFTGPVRHYHQIANEFVQFCGPDAELWAYYAGHDWWLVSQLFGGFMKMPSRSMYVNDIKALSVLRNRHNFPAQWTGEHHALHDARWNKRVYDYIMSEIEPGPYD